MSNEGGEDLQRLKEARDRAATKIENLLKEMHVNVGDTLTVTYQNGTSRTTVFNGWQETEAGSKYIKLGSGAVPPVYIVDIELKRES